MFGIKSAIVCKKSLIAPPIYSKTFLNIKGKSFADKPIYFHNKEIPKVGAYYTCLAVLFIDFVLK